MPNIRVTTAASTLNSWKDSQVRTRESQYQAVLETVEKKGLASLGLMTGQVWQDDPRRLAILLSRYKFVAKMLTGKKSVVEVGCADAFGTRVVQQEVPNVTVLDFDPIFINDVVSRAQAEWPLTALVHDILDGPIPDKPYEAAYSLDVIEHISKSDEDTFMRNIADSVGNNGVFIVGSPSLDSQIHASAQSKIGHVNCKTAEELRDLLERFFYNIFIFSMNDEVVHTGFYPMAHYYFAICCGPIR